MRSFAAVREDDRLHSALAADVDAFPEDPASGQEAQLAHPPLRLDPVLAGRIADALTAAEVIGERRAEGETYTRVDGDLVVEVLAGSGRHGTLTVTRMR